MKTKEIHGEARNRTTGMTREYRIWAHAKNRCSNPANKDHRNYGGRGIKFCARWADSYAAFLADMGRAPAGQSLGRINNDGDYEPGNCRWETNSQQSNNARHNMIVEYQGRKQTMIQWERELGFRSGTIRWRLKNGWQLNEAMTRKPSPLPR